MSVEVNIIKIDGKPLEKLISVISKGIGKLYRPREIRKEADAEAYKIEVIEKAKSTAKATAIEIDVDSRLRIENRLAHQEAKRQINIDKVSYLAAEQLQGETEVSDEEVDEDWITRFFTSIQDISNEDMQVLWARILAGEVKKPKSFSLRTLDFLKNISQEDAKLLTNLSKYSILNGTNNVIVYKPFHDLFRDKWGLTYTNFLYLIELGILHPNDAALPFVNTKKNSQMWFSFGPKAVVFKRKIDGGKFEVNVTTFTKIGDELMKLINKNPSEEYIKEFIKLNINTRLDIAAQIGQEVGVNKDGTRLYNNFVDFIPE